MPHQYLRLFVLAALGVLSGCTSPNLFSGLSPRNRQAASTPAEPSTTGEGLPADNEMPARLTIPPAKSNARKTPWRNRQSQPTASQLLAESERERQAGQLISARAACEQALKLDPANVDAQYQLARIADDERKFPEAERIYQSLLKDRPNDPAVLTSLGWSYYQQGRLDDSERCLREAIAVQPRNQVALYNLGLVLGTRGNQDAAWECFRAAGTEDQARKAMAMLTGTDSATSASGETAKVLADRDRRLMDSQASSSGGEKVSAPSPWNHSGAAAVKSKQSGSSEIVQVVSNSDPPAMQEPSTNGVPSRPLPEVQAAAPVSDQSRSRTSWQNAQTAAAQVGLSAGPGSLMIPVTDLPVPSGE
jgi:Tfp pilus assembly protein PilF